MVQHDLIVLRELYVHLDDRRIRFGENEVRFDRQQRVFGRGALAAAVRGDQRVAVIGAEIIARIFVEILRFLLRGRAEGADAHEPGHHEKDRFAQKIVNGVKRFAVHIFLSLFRYLCVNVRSTVSSEFTIIFKKSYTPVRFRSVSIPAGTLRSESVSCSAAV